MHVKNEFAFTNKPTCPNCKVVLDACTRVDGAPDTPSPGDYTACPYCMSIAMFDEGLQLRPLTEEELKEFKLLNGGISSAMTEVAMVTYRAALAANALKQALHFLKTGEWPEEEEEELTL
jgi:hypothetical protein